MLKSKPLFEFLKLYNEAEKKRVQKGTEIIKMIYSNSDNSEIEIGKNKLILNKNDIYITNGDENIIKGNESNFKIFVIECVCKFLKDIKYEIITIFGTKKFLIDSITNEYNAFISLNGKKDEKGYGQMIKVLFEQFFILLLRDQSKEIRGFHNNAYYLDKQTVAEVIDYLKEHISERLKFSDVVKHTNISATGLKKIFREQVGMGVIKYYNILKIENAKLLLNEGKYNISQISEILGYESVHYFSKQFKNITGKSPGVYTK